MRIAINKKRISGYSICLFFFFLAGFFQMIDDLFPDFWHVLFSLLAHVILLSLVIFWGVSIIHRIIRKDLRLYLLIIAIFILFFLVVRMIKYGLTRNDDILNRYLWYSYYVSQCLIPPTLLLASLSIEKKDGKPLKKTWFLIFIPAIILLSLIYTNDLHQLTFLFEYHNNEFSYKHGIVFYLSIIWEILITILSLIIMIIKCQVSACRKKIWIPIFTFLGCVFISTICFLVNISSFKIPELLCFSCIMIIESCIDIGLIPSNINYEKYFYHSMCSAFITDENLQVIYRSKSSLSLDKEQLKAAIISPIMIDKNTKFYGTKIHGGYTFRSEDLSLINEINNGLQEAKQQTKEENDIIEAENEMKKQSAKIDEQKKLYEKVETYTKDEINKLNNILQLKTINEEDFINKMRFACVLAAYIKRRSNLIILSKKDKLMDVNELELSINESISYLSLSNIDCFLDCKLKGKINSDILGIIYDFFEMCVGIDPYLQASFLVHLYQKEKNIIIKIESDLNKNYLPLITKKLINKFSSNVSIQHDGITTYFSLFLPLQGVL